MILIKRGDEPSELEALRTKKLAELRKLGRAPIGDDIDGYRGKNDSIAKELCKTQHKKCCYCEERIKTKFNHVEHYRPKGRATRAPGCHLTHGYWWLAFSWDNLLFSCPSCNSSGKGDQFPLEHGSTSLQPEQFPPGNEKPLLLNPCSNINPVEHIIFIQESLSKTNPELHWRAHARNNSALGRHTIKVCKLNSQDLLENRNYHIKGVIQPQVKAIRDSITAKQTDEIQKQYQRAIAMLTPSNEYVALSYDAFRHFIPDTQLQYTINKSWPRPDQIGR